MGGVFTCMHYIVFVFSQLDENAHLQLLWIMLQFAIPIFFLKKEGVMSPHA